ncbi:hypothetical protein [Psychrobacter aquaticus]|uniref:Uncharacterized protein n=1 Tax=Psychrobacter aquaticus CMS 56 TaxID=1354303 RepID=U4T3D0_9GAMM|nr:hypothetical protein [Psychrobacter aquaticus]ERL55697.1 hypothetical protein M917_1434 [Psychrobacter aquaticus CMS 56]
MNFSEALYDLPNVNLTKEQVNELHSELKNLERFFNENYKNDDKFASDFVDKFSSLLEKYGFYLDVQESFLNNLYPVAEFKNLAGNIIIMIRNTSHEDDFCEFTYEQMIEEMQNDSEY